MRIHRYKDGSHTINQQLFTKTIIKRFCPDNASYGTPTYQDTPEPLLYQPQKKYEPTEAESRLIQKEFSNLKYVSAVCTLLYLALGTRPDITWIVMKLAKSCKEPGIADYNALLHLLGYLRKYNNYAIKYYANEEESPVYKICRTHNIEPTDITAFSDASWQDCKDTRRSTIGNKIFYYVGLIEWKSNMPTPVAQSSAESEYMAACSACMAMSHLSMW